MEKSTPAPHAAVALGVNRLDDNALVASIKENVEKLRLLVCEADRRDIAASFAIRKPTGGLKGNYEAECNITKRL